MAIKLLISGLAGAGKTELLRTLGKESFVVSRDAKQFSLPIPHMLVDVYYDMDTLLYGSTIKDEDGNDQHIPGITDKLEAYEAKFGQYPENVVIDSVSQIFMDVIDKASQTPNVYGSQGAEITKEIGKLTQFIHEFLELNGVNVILINHVIEEKADGKLTGELIPFGSGKFLQKGGFYSTTNEAATLVIEGSQRVVYLRDPRKQARTMLTFEQLPDKMYLENTVHPDKSKKLKEGEEYFSLKAHLQKLIDNQLVAEEWSI